VDGVFGGEVAAATTTQRPGPRTTEAPDGGRPRARRSGGVYFAWGAADGAWGRISLICRPTWVLGLELGSNFSPINFEQAPQKWQ